MFNKENIKQLKTTITGFLIMGASIAYPYFQSSSNTWIFGIMFCVGLALLFLPNTLISSLKKLLSNNSDKKF